MDRNFFKGKKVLVMGLGRFGGGLDTVKFAHKQGAIVTVTDLATADKLEESLAEIKHLDNIQYKLGIHDPKDFETSDIIIANPAVPPNNKFLQIAGQNNRFVTSQINIFFELTPASIIGITGSNGKSTTTALTAHLLRAATGQKGFKYRKVWLSGNIGDEPLLAILDQIQENDLVVLELSSFQIEQLAEIKKAPLAALLTNLTPNHLDRHGTFEEYAKAKEYLFKYQKPQNNQPCLSVFNAEDKVGCEWFEKYSKESGRICKKFKNDNISDTIRKSYNLPGVTYLANLAAAAEIARFFGTNDSTIINALPSFKGLPHRLELVADIDGIRWYNDSKATTPLSTMVALDSFDCPQIIIAGGYDKHIPFDDLGKKIAQKAKAAILIGQTAKKIASAIEADSKSNTKIIFSDSLKDAVSKARQIALKNDVILLSPACASYDMFINFEQRGMEFAQLANKID